MDNENKEARTLKPPYVAYKTFKNFVERLNTIGLPNQIDRSVMTSMSGGVQSQLEASFKYLGLVKDSKAPTEKLQGLILASGKEEWNESLQEILKSAYSFLFRDGLNLERATSQQIYDKFSETGATGETVRKCIAFFISAAKDSKLPISPHIQITKGSSASGPKRRKRNIASNGAQGGDTELPSKTRHLASGQEMSEQDRMAWDRFPPFDPNWDVEQQKLWYENFHRLSKGGKETDL